MSTTHLRYEPSDGVTDLKQDGIKNTTMVTNHFDICLVDGVVKTIVESGACSIVALQLRRSKQRRERKRDPTERSGTWSIVDLSAGSSDMCYR